jgi:hypothetical protein
LNIVLKQIAPFLNRNGLFFVSHSVFKDQISLSDRSATSVAFLSLSGRTMYVSDIESSTVFPNLFSEQILAQISSAPKSFFVSNKAGHPTHLSLYCNPIFELFLEQFLIRFRPALQPVLFRTRRRIVRTLIFPATPF